MKLAMVGLGRMGANMALRLTRGGHTVIGHARHEETVQRARDEGAIADGTTSLTELVGKLSRPRIVWLMVPAASVDQTLEELAPLLNADDVVIDGGNSFYRDDVRRAATLRERGIHYLDVGTSGGTWGLERGYCLMIGGEAEPVHRLTPIFTTLAPGRGSLPRTPGRENVGGTAEEGYLHCGPSGAGHFVKMVHNGIEYALEQLIAEVYDLLRRGLGLNFDEMAEVFAGFNQGRVKSYLVEITSHILKRRDPESGQPLVDLIKDVAQQQGTGLWTVRTALDLGVPIPTIDVAVGLRRLSALKEEREAAAGVLPGPGPFFPGPGDRQGFIEKLGNALFASMVTTFAQGLTLLRRASEVYGYNLDLAEVVRLWRGGCIIRAALLEEVMAACRARPDLPNLLLDPVVGGKVTARQGDWREVAKAAAAWGLPAPALMASLAYLDAYRSRRLPASLIQAMRDCFGAHTYEREDSPGTFHTNWLAD